MFDFFILIDILICIGFTSQYEVYVKYFFSKQSTTIRNRQTLNHDNVLTLIMLRDLVQLDINMQRSYIEDRFLSEKIISKSWILMALSVGF
jgi:hypothetical protein